MVALRVCFVGDSITAGTGDGEFLGWPGRLCRRETARGHDVTLYNLGIRGDTSEMVAARWAAECAARLPPTVPGALVFSFGVNDMAFMEGAFEEGAGLRVPADRSVAVARALIQEAARRWPVLWIGPVPVPDDLQPFRGPAGVFHFHTGRCVALCSEYARVAVDLGVPYLSIIHALQTDPRWDAAQRACDGVHPTGAGYAMIADLVEAWPAWRAWFAG